MKRLLVPSATLCWGLQFAFLNPALALLLVALYDASATEVGAALAAYNASGFVASLLVPAWADRRGDYLRPLLICGVLTLALALALATVTSLPAVVVALVVVGGPAGVGNFLLFAHLRASGASAATIVNTRAVVSTAWVAGPPLATVIVTAAGQRALLIALAVVAVLTIATTAAMTSRSAVEDVTTSAGRPADDHVPLPRLALVAVVVAFVALQATNAAAVSVMSLFVTDRLGLDVVWSGITLGVAAGLEIPALLLVGRLAQRLSPVPLLVSGCLAGIVYYGAVAFTSGPIALLVLQALNAWFFAVVAGVGLTLFQRVIPRPGLASGLFTNTRRIGAIVSGPLIAVGATSALGYGGVFLGCAVLSAVGLALLAPLARAGAAV